LLIADSAEGIFDLLESNFRPGKKID
jgi:hypothetical protein